MRLIKKKNVVGSSYFHEPDDPSSFYEEDIFENEKLYYDSKSYLELKNKVQFDGEYFSQETLNLEKIIMIYNYLIKYEDQNYPTQKLIDCLRDMSSSISNITRDKDIISKKIEYLGKEIEDFDLLILKYKMIGPRKDILDHIDDQEKDLMYSYDFDFDLMKSSQDILNFLINIIEFEKNRVVDFLSQLEVENDIIENSSSKAKSILSIH